MGNHTNIIEINGKRYDAVTGTFLGEVAAEPAKHTTTSAASKSGNQAAGQFIDGFRRPDRPVSQAAVSRGGAKKSAIEHKPHAPAASTARRKPEPAKTLMRSAVHKPEIKAPSLIKAQTRTDVLARAPQQTVAPKLSHSSVDPKRLKKATQMVKSPKVSRYGVESPLAALGGPAALSAHNLHQPATTSAPAVHHTHHAAGAIPTIPVSPVAQPAKQPDIFADALARATSHQEVEKAEARVSKKRRRIGGAITATLLLLAVAGYLTYTNIPSLSMQLASFRAGFSAKLPAYSPAGFTFGTLSYGKGNVTVSYTDPGDANRSFDITQRESNWDSQTLLTNFVKTANKAYQTYSRAGRTVYVYGNNTATWVDSGVWYTVNGNSSLSRDQILSLASSL